MADKQATYLPTYIGGRVQPGADLRGLRDPGPGLAAAGQRVAGQGAELGHAIQNFAQTYNNLLATRYSQDEDVRAHSLFREKRLASSMLKAEQADNLYFKDRDSMSELKDKFLENSPLGAEVSGRIFDKHAQTYLDWSAQHMLKEMNAAAKNTRKKVASATVREASIAPMTTGSLEELYKMADVLYPFDKVLADSFKDSIDQSFANSNIARDPSNFLEWMTANEAKLTKLMGANKFDKQLAKFITTARTMENQIWTRQERAEKLEKRKVEKGEREGLNFVQDAINNNEMLTDEQFTAVGEQLGLDALSVQKIRKYYYDTVSGVVKRDSDLALVAIAGQERPITEDQMHKINQAAIAGTITPATRDALEKRFKGQEQAAKTGLTVPRARATKLFESTAGGGMFGANSATKQMTLAVEEELDTYLSSIPPEARAKELSITNPDSRVNQLNSWLAEQVVEGSLTPPGLGSPAWTPSDTQIQKLQAIRESVDPKGTDIDAFLNAWEEKQP